LKRSTGKARGTGRVREEKAPYGTEQAGVVVLDYKLLGTGEFWMQSLVKKAALVSEALKKAQIPHAIIGGLAVASHVANVDEAAVRNTKDVDMLLRESDAERAAAVLKVEGFKYRKVLGIPIFALKGGSFRDAVHIVWADQRVKPNDLHPAPALDDTLVSSKQGFFCLALPSLLQMKLTSFRLKDKVHIQDMLEVGLINAKVRKSLPVDLRARLKEVEDETERERLG